MRRSFLIAFAGPLSLLLCLLLLAVTMAPEYQPSGLRAILDKWRPRVEPYKTQSHLPIVTTGGSVETAFYFERAAAALTTPTSDATGDCLHPDVVHVPGGWPATGDNVRKKYWMVMTPFAGADTSLENPEILCSEDGTTWAVPTGLTNPIAATPATGFHSDPCLVWNPQDKNLYCFWRWSLTGDGDQILCKTSADGVTWSATITVLDAGGVTAHTLASPQVRCVDGTWYLWAVDTNAAPNVVQVRTSGTPTGNYGAATTCTLTGGTEIFHVNMIWDGDAFYGIFKAVTDNAYFARSYDGLLWDVNTMAFMVANGATDWDEIPYQMSFIHRPEMHYFDVWYSAINSTPNPDLHRIGRGKLKYAPAEAGSIYGYRGADGVRNLTVEESNLRVRSAAQRNVVLIESLSDTTTAGYDPRIFFRHGATIATKAVMGVDVSDSMTFKLSPSEIGTNDGLRMTSAGVTTIPTGLVIPVGITPSPDVEGALFLDSDAGANGTLKMYSNAAWRTVTAF